MNMISTGAFLPEMDASNKQETMAEKFARVWEKKNSKVAKAGGVSLMALSLAACGSSSDETAATPTTPTTPTTPAEPTTPAGPTGQSFELKTTTDSIFGTAGDDTITASNLTMADGDVVADSSGTDSDTMVVSAAADITAKTTVVGIENVQLNVTSALSSGDTRFSMAMDNISTPNVSVDVTATDSLVSAVTLDNVKTGAVINLSDDFSSATIDGVDDGSYTINLSADAAVVVTGATVDGVTIASAKDVTVTSSTNDGALTVSGEVLDISATAAAGEVNLTATDNVDIQDLTAATSLVVNAAGTVTIDTKSDAATSVNVTTTGGEDDEHDVIIESGAFAGATSVTINSAGSIDQDQAGTTATLAAATTIDLAADDDSNVTASLATGATFASNDADGVTFTASLGTVDSLVMTGANELTVAIDASQLDTETVTNTNTGASIIGLGLNANANFDLSDVATSVLIRLDDEADTANNTIVAASGAQIAFDDATAQSVALDIDAKTTTATDNVLNLSTSNSDGATAGDETSSVSAALVLNDWATINLDATAAAFTTSSTITSNEATKFNISGSKAVTLTTVAGAAAGAEVDASGLAAAFSMTLDNTANAAETVRGGSKVDTITVSSASLSGSTFTVYGNGGADVVNMTAATSIDFKGGAGVDTLGLDNSLNFSTSTLTLEAVEQINVDGAVTVNASVLDAKTMLISATQVGGADTANDVLTLAMDDTDFNGGNIAFADSFTNAGTDKIIIDGSGIGLAQTITGTLKVDEITTAAGADNITAGDGADVVTSGTGNDIIDISDSDDAVDSVIFTGYATNGVNTIKGFVSTEDTITLASADTSMTTTSGNAVFVQATTALVTAGAAYDLSAVVLDTRDDFIEITTTLDDDVTLSATSTGASLFEALSSDSGAISGITVAAASDAYALAVYQNNNAYIWNVTDGGDGSIAAGEVTLISVIEGITAGGLDTGDILMSA